MLEITGADVDRLASRKKLEETEKDLSEVASPRLRRPDVHLKQVREAWARRSFIKVICANPGGFGGA
jgi:hypothetical protein